MSTPPTLPESPCGMGPSDLDAGLGAEPSAAERAAMLRALIAQAPSPATTPTSVLETSLIVEGSDTRTETQGG